MRALVTGVTGMDGYYLAEHLIDTGHEVLGMVRGQRTDAVLPEDMGVVRGDLTDQSSLLHLLYEHDPDIVYNLGAVTAIGLSWTSPRLVAEVNGTGVLSWLEAIRLHNRGVRFVQASTADQYGPLSAPADEATPFAPRSPYAVAKQYAHDMVLTYRSAHGVHASTMVMFNHSGARHGTEFVVAKVCRAAARIKLGKQDKLALGPIDAKRDWGYSPDYMRAWALAGAADAPGDYVLATGELRSVEDLVAEAFSVVGLPWREYVTHDESFSRPADVAERSGDATKAGAFLGWEPTTTFDQMITTMVRYHLTREKATP